MSIRLSEKWTWNKVLNNQKRVFEMVYKKVYRLTDEAIH